MRGQSLSEDPGRRGTNKVANQLRHLDLTINEEQNALSQNHQESTEWLFPLMHLPIPLGFACPFAPMLKLTRVITNIQIAGTKLTDYKHRRQPKESLRPDQEKASALASR